MELRTSRCIHAIPLAYAWLSGAVPPPLAFSSSISSALRYHPIVSAPTSKHTADSIAEPSTDARVPCCATSRWLPGAAGARCGRDGGAAAVHVRAELAEG
ncbi:hypothetical protein BDV98DRAFT_577114 [Pterulicium gracile]|uniref:Uncharacterized protein n=1 Tax=Pterulicium gracile TaxID=1884261 RepID=A0A5C3Q647_9AGAR|nr:hypothetical protein BDV98DRAFT_577114 [Pterula gracilis]